MTGLIERLLNPSFLFGLLLAAGLLLLATKRTQRSGQRLLAATAAVLLLVAVLPLGNWLLAPLEARFPPAPLPTDIAGIIAIGGAEQLALSAAHRQPMLNDNAERLLGLASLMRRYPQAKIVFAGGRGDAGAPGEAEVARLVLEQIGADSGRVHFLSSTSSTSGNANALAEAYPPNEDRPWVLVTSAWHMPRAVGTFHRQGFRIAAYPVDYRTVGPATLDFRLNLLGGLRSLQDGTREWMALLVYRLLGRTDDLLPGPAPR